MVDEFDAAKARLESTMQTIIEDSPSRQLARQKIRANSLFKARGYDSATKRSAPHSPLVLLNKKVARPVLERAPVSMYHLLRLWMMDSDHEHTLETSTVDIFNLPAPRSPPVLLPPVAPDPQKRKRVEDVVQGTGGEVPSPGALLHGTTQLLPSSSSFSFVSALELMKEARQSRHLQKAPKVSPERLELIQQKTLVKLVPTDKF